MQAQKKADEDEMDQQHTLLLTCKAARESVSEMDVKHEQALMEKECRAAKVHERDKLPRHAWSSMTDIRRC